MPALEVDSPANEQGTAPTEMPPWLDQAGPPPNAINQQPSFDDIYRDLQARYQREHGMETSPFPSEYMGPHQIEWPQLQPHNVPPKMPGFQAGTSAEPGMFEPGVRLDPSQISDQQGIPEGRLAPSGLPIPNVIAGMGPKDWMEPGDEPWIRQDAWAVDNSNKAPGIFPANKEDAQPAYPNNIVWGGPPNTDQYNDAQQFQDQTAQPPDPMQAILAFYKDRELSPEETQFWQSVIPQLKEPAAGQGGPPRDQWYNEQPPATEFQQRVPGSPRPNEVQIPVGPGQSNAVPDDYEAALAWEHLAQTISGKPPQLGGPTEPSGLFNPTARLDTTQIVDRRDRTPTAFQPVPRPPASSIRR